MFINVLKSKIHRAVVTEADLNYIGSITIDEDLMDAADIIENEKVQIVNNNNGKRFETYVISGERGSKIICLNGAAARLVHPGDIVIIISYGMLEMNEAKKHTPKVIFLDDKNKIVEVKAKEKHGNRN
ncbi:aspartate 1-decarboxylase [Herbivorax sp. ANBcel31]|uniref:aspartate 1-decarboxylase n=1 Tax=Herbivorax sp. ANBcel31 TaxID=3069754 RepID=UPI0027B646C7|nr:aspartate 1-decarboxylase [Herbivorax sp. ANBcel31]MDQ2087232.1 aspartate 1-decarboxylase [Herbivorax sp. ANBcel31]